MTSGNFMGWQMTDSTSSIHRILPLYVRLEIAVAAMTMCVCVFNNHN